MSVSVYEFPALGIEQVSFDLVVPRDMNRMEGRRTEGRVFGQPFWRAQYRVSYQGEAGMGKADAFMRRVVSRGGVFRAFDAFRSRPVAHDGAPLSGTRAGGGAFDGTATLAAINNARSVTVSALPANFQLSEGDHLCFAMSDLVVSLHSVEADAQADGSGVVTLSIDPALDGDVFTTDSVVHFEKPFCLMQVTEYSNPKSWSSRNPTFSAEETFFYEPDPQLNFIFPGNSQYVPVIF